MQSADFYREGNGRLYRAISENLTDGRGVDAVLLREDLKRRGDLDFIGGPEFLVHLLDVTPTAAHARYYAEQVKEYALKRGVIAAADEFRKGGMNGRMVAEVLRDHRVRVDDLEREAGGVALKVFSASDIPTLDIPPIKPLVGPNLVSEGSILFVVGQPGLHKTYAVYDLALMLARGGGGQWLGLSVMPEPVPVLWLFGEGGRARVKERGLQLTGGKDLPERLKFYVPDEYALDLCKATDIARVRVRCEELMRVYSSPTVFLVVDPLADWAVYDQNKEADILLRGIRALQRKVNATWCLVHHPKKPGQGFTKGDASNMRGDSRLHGAADSVLMFDREGEGQVRATWSKHNNAPAQDAMIFRFDAEAFRLKSVCKVGDRVRANDAIRNALRDAHEAGVEWQTKYDIRKATGLGLSTIEKWLSQGVKDGSLERDGAEGGTMSRYRLTESWEG